MLEALPSRQLFLQLRQLGLILLGLAFAEHVADHRVLPREQVAEEQHPRILLVGKTVAEEDDVASGTAGDSASPDPGLAHPDEDLGAELPVRDDIDLAVVPEVAVAPAALPEPDLCSITFGTVRWVSLAIS